jgi:hypothetical protein
VLLEKQVKQIETTTDTSSIRILTCMPEKKLAADERKESGELQGG